MRVNEKRMFPYPVYRKGSEDFKDVVFETNTQLYYDSETASIQFDVLIEDSAIVSLLENNQIGLFCHVECSKTKYREVFELDGTDKSKQSIDIELSKLNGDIEVLCFLVTKEEITDFHDENLSEFYADEVVRFPQYARIGYSEPFETRIIKHLNINGAIPSIFSVYADPKIDIMTYEMAEDKIHILLPENEHNIYRDYIGVDPKTKVMMLNLAVLTEIINKIQNEEDFTNYNWFSVVCEAFAKKGYDDLSSSKFKAKQAVELAQILMPDLCKNAFKEFDEAHKSNSKED